MSKELPGPLSGRHMTDYELLCNGRSLGKKVNVLVGTSNAFNSKVNLLEVKGPDAGAMNLQIALMPPRVIPVYSGAGPNPGLITEAQAFQLVNSQNASGTELNDSTGMMQRNFIWSPMIAVLEWGIGGQAVERVEVDILNGLNVNLSASYLRIGVEVDPLIGLLHGNFGDFSPGLYELGAFVGPGFAKRRNAQRTVMFQNSLGFTTDESKTSPIVPIPKFATSFWMNATPVNVGLPTVGWEAQVVWLLSAGNGVPYALGPNIGATGAIKIGSHTITDNSEFVEIPIPNGAQYFCIVNRSGFGIQPSVVFNLGI